MHILFVHKNFPAQFGHIASYLIKKHGFQCSFASELPSGDVDGIQRVQYKIQGGATKSTHYCSRTFENAVWHSHAVHEAMKARPDIKPDLVEPSWLHARRENAARPSGWLICTTVRSSTTSSTTIAAKVLIWTSVRTSRSSPRMC